MIQLTRLNNSVMNLNSDLIKFIEQSPDTVVTLVNGEKILVREKPDEILRQVLRYRRSILQGFFPAWDLIGMVKTADEEPASEHSSEPSDGAR
jgi:flagellar protein FlbD